MAREMHHGVAGRVWCIRLEDYCKLCPGGGVCWAFHGKIACRFGRRRSKCVRTRKSACFVSNALASSAYINTCQGCPLSANPVPKI